MPRPLGYVPERRRTKEELDRIIKIILEDDLDADAVEERWGVMKPTARKWLQRVSRLRKKVA